MPGTVWYERFDELLDSVEVKRERYEKRCEELGVPKGVVQDELRRDLIARIVRESNWQEQLYLGLGQTRELANAALDETYSIQGPHIDINRVCKQHRDAVVKLYSGPHFSDRRLSYTRRAPEV